MGLGALGMVKGPGWGTEVLRRYRLLGGTPETLNRTLRNRAIDTDARDRIVTGYRNATDLAAPGPRETGGQDVGTAQHRAMEWAGRGYEERGRQAPQWDWNSNRTYPTSHIDDVTGPPSFEGMKSGSMGNAAYNAVSRQAARLIDEGLLGFKKSTYGPRGRVSDAQYAKEFPINNIDTITSDLTSQELRESAMRRQAIQSIREQVRRDLPGHFERR
jgi:hypothetical protein